MEYPNYRVFFRSSNNKKQLKEKEFLEVACFSFLRQEIRKYYEIRLVNRFDKWSKEKGLPFSTKAWLKLFPCPNIETKVEEDFFYIYFDTRKFSYAALLSILTIYRYPGEFYNICYNYWKLKEVHPTLKKWEAFFLAHQGSFKEYSSLFGTSMSYNNGHSIFTSGQSLRDFKIVNTIKTLAKIPHYPEYGGVSIQPIWCKPSYKVYKIFDGLSTEQLRKINE